MGNIFNTRSEFEKREAQERLEELNVSYGNAPVAKDSETSVPVAGPATIDASSLTNQTTSDNKCPSCGATLAFDPATGGLVCNFCGASVALNTMPAAPGIGYTLEDLNYTAGQHYLRMVNKLIVCGTCGGTFVADQSAMSGLCPYCGSNSITETTSSGMLEPTGVIPFKISKEQAQAMFKDWVVKRKMAPMDIAKNAEITDLTGVYVPY
jgi:DNA-directed RNA polymerase subunit RPC12/RpoP